jgi:hypothetical protein
MRKYLITIMFATFCVLYGHSQIFGFFDFFIFVNMEKQTYYEKMMNYESFGYLEQKTINSYSLKPKYDTRKLPLQFVLKNFKTDNTRIKINLIPKNIGDTAYVSFRNEYLVINDTIIISPIPDSLCVDYDVKSIALRSVNLHSEILRFEKSYANIDVFFEIDDRYFKLVPWIYCMDDDEIIIFEDKIVRTILYQWKTQTLFPEKHYLSRIFLPYDSLHTFDVETYWK